jgi:two-component system alkaline phosphatase synthesis response regulator PhoP
MKQILVVDDEPRIAEICRDYLKRAGFEVITAINGDDALALARSRQPDLIVLDLTLPGRDGLDVTRALRQRSNVPIIMLTARIEESDKLVGLELGADDYLTKPFSPRELVARVRAVLRRGENATVESEVVRAADVTLDVPRRKTRVGTRSVELTSSEFQLLATLMRQPGRVFTRSQLLDTIRGEEGDSFERAVDAHVKNLRRKIERDPRKPKYLQTVYGVGYRFTDA